ncbi:MAG: NAD(P)-dependent oxidoreductase [candidate division NC10 bacterium]|nr:NAD(P)-dependent oxidoreductase [candidate division NC10 bacterium]
MNVGFIGLGLMGQPMATNVLKAGFSLIVYNRTPEKVKALVALGARPAGSPMALGEDSEIVITMVSDHEALWEVILGPQGALIGAKPGTIFIDMSTVPPDVSCSVASEVSKAGCHMLDAPVMGSVGAAVKGELTILVGGDQAVLQKAEPVLRTMGKALYHVGGNGGACFLKLALNAIGLTQIEILGETLLLTERAGLKRDQVLEILSAIGLIRSPFVETRLEKIRKQEYLPPTFTVRNAVKDLTYGLKAAEKTGLKLETAKSVLDRYRSLMAEGKGQHDVAAATSLG